MTDTLAVGGPGPGVPLLEMRDVTKVFGGSRRQAGVSALQSFSVTLNEAPARIVAVAGESGSGKTTAANLVLGLMAPTSGRILYRGQDVTALDRQARTAFRREVQAITQDPYAAFNPFYRTHHVFDVVVRNFRLAGTREESARLVRESLEFVGLEPERVLAAFPHQLSGGERQRVMIARAFLLRPRLIVADEPVSMVDASIRATILELMLRLKDELGVSFLYITHDLSTAYRVADDLVVLRRGEIVEQGEPRTVIDAPRHPYTKLLIGSIPIPDPDARWQGSVADLARQAGLEDAG